MLVTVLHRVEGEPDNSEFGIRNSEFTDVGTGMYYSNAIIWANAYGIVQGYGDGKFGPNDNITREQLMAILYRYNLYKGADVSAAGSLDAFSDGGKISTWARDAMRYGAGAGLMKGFGGKINPAGTATRAETATTLARLLGLEV